MTQEPLPRYLVVPVDSEDGGGLVCRIGAGNECITNTQSHAAVVTASEMGQVLAAWKFHVPITIEQAEEMALLISPDCLLICSSERFEVLELSHDYITQVDVVDVRPGKR